ncbi:hypothetical protein, partial [Serratia marcescens]|uniref:hypothetical protein n=1 Tax=Serratia marcescens TaxID=615 RepID=UPI0013DB479D
MVGRRIAGLLMAAAAGLVAAGSPAAGQEVLLRKSSPDGVREAVLMNCRDPSNPSAQQLIGAVFRREPGQAPGCRD